MGAWEDGQQHGLGSRGWLCAGAKPLLFFIGACFAQALEPPSSGAVVKEVTFVLGLLASLDTGRVLSRIGIGRLNHVGFLVVRPVQGCSRTTRIRPMRLPARFAASPLLASVLRCR